MTCAQSRELDRVVLLSIAHVFAHFENNLQSIRLRYERGCIVHNKVMQTIHNLFNVSKE